MGKRLDDADLGAYHFAATAAAESGFKRVEIDPRDVILMVDELRKYRRAAVDYNERTGAWEASGDGTRDGDDIDGV